MAKSQKGSKFEREICKQLSMWFTKNRRDDIFWRTAGSGARATCRAKQGKMTADSGGDICAIHESGKYLTSNSIWELKKGYTKGSPANKIGILPFIDNLPTENYPLILKWVRKLQEEAQTHNREMWFIIFKRDRKQAVICMDSSTLAILNKRNPYRYNWPPFGPVAMVYIDKLCLVFFQLDRFLKWCSPNSITNRIKRRRKKLDTCKFKENLDSTKFQKR